MASSVSSERAFSQGGLTISPRRNRLKADVVEAIQFVKCSVQKDLIFREAAPSSATEVNLEAEQLATADDDMADSDDAGSTFTQPGSWCSLLDLDDEDLYE